MFFSNFFKIYGWFFQCFLKFFLLHALHKFPYFHISPNFCYSYYKSFRSSRVSLKFHQYFRINTPELLIFVARRPLPFKTDMCSHKWFLTVFFSKILLFLKDLFTKKTFFIFRKRQFWKNNVIKKIFVMNLEKYCLFFEKW